MKKITMMTFLMVAPFLIGAQTFNFNTDGSTEDWVSYGSSTKVVAGGILTYMPVTATRDANIQYKKGIDASSSRYVHIVLNTHSAVTETLTFEFRNPGSVLTSVSVDPSASVGFVTYDIDLNGKTGWSGTVSDIRIRMRSSTNTDPADYYEFDQIVFDNNAVLSIEQLEKFNFSYFPNPAKDWLKLSSAKSIKNITLFNLLGQQVLTKTFNNQKEVDLNISNFKTGTYIMKVQIEDAVGTFKFSKN